MMKRLEISSAYLSRSRVENLYSLQSETCGIIMVERGQNESSVSLFAERNYFLLRDISFCDKRYKL